MDFSERIFQKLLSNFPNFQNSFPGLKSILGLSRTAIPRIGHHSRNANYQLMRSREIKFRATTYLPLQQNTQRVVVYHPYDSQHQGHQQQLNLNSL